MDSNNNVIALSISFQRLIEDEDELNRFEDEDSNNVNSIEVYYALC